MQDKIKIRLIGIGCRILCSDIDNSLWELMQRTAKNIKVPIKHAFFDSDFYKELNNSKYKCLYDFNDTYNLKGLLCTGKSFIEIWLNRKKALKVYSRNVLAKNLLFPLYNVKTEEINIKKENIPDKKRIVFIEDEVGTTGTYAFYADKFDIDKLLFSVKKIYIENNDSYLLMTNIFYDNKHILNTRSDTLIIGGGVVEM